MLREAPFDRPWPLGPEAPLVVKQKAIGKQQNVQSLRLKACNGGFFRAKSPLMKARHLLVFPHCLRLPFISVLFLKEERCWRETFAHEDVLDTNPTDWSPPSKRKWCKKSRTSNRSNWIDFYRCLLFMPTTSNNCLTENQI